VIISVNTNANIRMTMIISVNTNAENKGTM